MKRLSILIAFGITFLCFASCSKEIKDGPYIYFNNYSSIPDTITSETILPLGITAIGNGYKVTRAQLFVNKTEFFDTTFSATDSISISWNMAFNGRIKTQNIVKQATNENDMIATTSKKIYITK